MARFSFFGEGLPDIDLAELKGKLIVLEGTDGVGRSTQIGLLKQWLENHGHAVLDTGMTRSALAGKRLKQAKEGHTLGGITMSLVLCHRLRRSPGKRNYSGAARRLYRADRPIHLFADGARDRARRRSRMAPRSLRFRPQARCDFLFASVRWTISSRESCRAADSITGSRAWICTWARTVRKFRALSEMAVRRVRQNGRGLRFQIIDASGSVEEVFKDLRDRVDSVVASNSI